MQNDPRLKNPVPSRALIAPETPARRRLLLASAASGAWAWVGAPAISWARDLELDVPYVPTPMTVVDRMLEMAKVGKRDLVYDLGCGDGRIVIRAAERFGCRGVGVDLDPVRVNEAKANAEKAKVQSLVRFEVGNVFTYDFSPATVVTMYLLRSVNMRLRPRLLAELKPGTRIVSHAFDLGDWKPEQTARIDGSNVFMWTVPSRG
jgi:SAM-dependent methyltransferase